MKYIKFTPGTVDADELRAKLNTHFGDKYKVTNLKKEITVAEDKAIGCKVIVMKKRLMINGTFATTSRMAIAMVVLLLTGILIPMIIYMVIYKPKFQAIEKEVYEYLQTEFDV